VWPVDVIKVTLMRTMVAMPTIASSLSATLRTAREDRGMTVSALAEASGVSRAMISKVERDEAQPTAALLGRLSGALGMTLSELVARAERGDVRVARRDAQPVWTDPASGYRRRAVSPVSGGPMELVEVWLPAGAHVAMPADSYTFIHQQIWVLEGSLLFVEDDVEHRLETGDCLVLGPPAPCAFVNESASECRYLVAVARR
jgi:transcriptional regulator with XRE-family HTH domain